MLQKLQAFWASLPHFVQALIVAFVGGAGAEIGKIAADYPNICISGVCLKHDVGLIIGAGVVAMRAFYMLPNGTIRIAENKAGNPPVSIKP